MESAPVANIASKARISANRYEFILKSLNSFSWIDFGWSKNNIWD